MSSALSSEQENNFPSPNLTPLFGLAALAAKAWAAVEDDRLKEVGKAWGTYNSPIDEYNREYSHVSEGSTIEQRLDEVIAKKGSAVCIILGTDNNPLDEYMREKNQDGKQRVTVITVGLEERRSVSEREEAEALGHYALATTIGAPDGFIKLQGLMDELRAEKKIQEAKADVLVTRLLAGWESIPFREHLYHILNKTQLSRVHSLTSEDRILSARIEDSLARLSDKEARELFDAYGRWFIRSVRGLLTQQKATVLADIPREVFPRVSHLVKPNELFHYRIPGAFKLAAYADPQETSYTICLELN